MTSEEDFDFGDSNFVDDAVKVIDELKKKISEQAAQIAALKDALVEERARRICHNPKTDVVGHWPRYEDVVIQEARQQLEAEYEAMR